MLIPAQFSGALVIDNGYGGIYIDAISAKSIVADTGYGSMRAKKLSSQGDIILDARSIRAEKINSQGDLTLSVKYGLLICMM